MASQEQGQVTFNLTQEAVKLMWLSCVQFTSPQKVKDTVFDPQQNIHKQNSQQFCLKPVSFVAKCWHHTVTEQIIFPFNGCLIVCVCAGFVQFSYFFRWIKIQ